MCQSHTGRLTGFWFLLNRPKGWILMNEWIFCVYQFTRTEQIAPDRSEADGSLQNCGPAVRTLFLVNLLAPSVWGFLDLWSLLVTSETVDQLSWNLALAACWSIHIPAFYCCLYWSWRTDAWGEILTTIWFLRKICKNTERSYTHDCAECNEQHGRRVQSVFCFLSFITAAAGNIKLRIGVCCSHCGARGSAFGWSTVLQVGRSRVRFPMVSVEFFIENPSGRTMALGLTQPLTEMSTRNFFLGVKMAGA